MIGSGEDAEAFHVKMDAIKEKPYFSADNLGFLTSTGNTFEFKQPCLKQMDPEDFILIIEYLESGQFGQQVVENDDDRQRMLAQCGAAWGVAERLGMVDLLEHIVNKLNHAIPWEPEEVLILAELVYITPAALSLQAHEDMKDMLSNFVARNFDDYIINHRRAFLATTAARLEFKADVHEKVAVLARMELEDEENQDV